MRDEQRLSNTSATHESSSTAATVVQPAAAQQQSQHPKKVVIGSWNVSRSGIFAYLELWELEIPEEFHELGDNSLLDDLLNGWVALCVQDRRLFSKGSLPKLQTFDEIELTD